MEFEPTLTCFIRVSNHTVNFNKMVAPTPIKDGKQLQFNFSAPIKMKNSTLKNQDWRNVDPLNAGAFPFLFSNMNFLSMA